MPLFPRFVNYRVFVTFGDMDGLMKLKRHRPGPPGFRGKEERERAGGHLGGGEDAQGLQPAACGVGGGLRGELHPRGAAPGALGGLQRV